VIRQGENGGRYHQLARLVGHFKGDKSNDNKELARSTLHMVNQACCKPPIPHDADFPDAWFERLWNLPDRPGFGQLVVALPDLPITAFVPYEVNHGE
jgi:hypothetical protein